MRKYGKTGKLETVICNMCGKKIVVKDGIVRKGRLRSTTRGIIFQKKTERSIISICANRATMSWWAGSGSRWTWRSRQSFFRKYAGMYRRAQVKSYFTAPSLASLRRFVI